MQYIYTHIDWAKCKKRTTEEKKIESHTSQWEKNKIVKIVGESSGCNRKAVIKITVPK
jgi:hypothetical protein